MGQPKIKVFKQGNTGVNSKTFFKAFLGRLILLLVQGHYYITTILIIFENLLETRMVDLFRAPISQLSLSLGKADISCR